MQKGVARLTQGTEVLCCVSGHVAEHRLVYGLAWSGIQPCIGRAEAEPAGHDLGHGCMAQYGGRTFRTSRRELHHHLGLAA